jgi:hypothetical protein
MRLTNVIRQAFVRAAMQDVPKVDFQAQAEVIVRKAVQEIFAEDFPGIDFRKAQNSGWLEKRSISVPGRLKAVYMATPSYEILKDRRKDVWAVLCAIGEQHAAQIEQRTRLTAQLEGAANACTTRKQLAEVLPEFEKYLPEDEAKAVRSLPALANVAAEFIKAGWPKSATQGAAK